MEQYKIKTHIIMTESGIKVTPDSVMCFHFVIVPFVSLVIMYVLSKN